MKCSHCQRDNAPGAKFCEECAAPLQRVCVSCGALVSPAAKFCPECAHPVGKAAAAPEQFDAPERYTPKHPAEKIPAPKSAPEGERRQLTVLFCDMVGFTELTNRVDPEVLQRIIRAYEDACAVCITRYEGYVFQRLGDGIVAFFGYPLAHEGEAERAIHAGLEIIEALSKLHVPDAGHLSVRIGIATGLVVVSSAEKGAVGEAMNLASRLQGIAQPGSIVVSERVHRLAGGSFEYQDLGEQSLKGIARPTHAYRIVGVSEAASRFDAATQEGLTPLVGRQQEIGLLVERWALAQDGDGQVVLLSGEPGIGKSRILSALRERLEGQGAQTLRFQCSPYYVNSALWPSIDNFERALKFGRDESPESKLDQLEALVVTHHGRPLSDVRFVASMLSIPCEVRYGALPMTPQKHKDETLRTLVALTEATARRQPSVMLFEDLHWADPTTLEVLDLLIDRVKDIPLLIVLTHRPELQSRWTQHGHVLGLNLSKLTRAQSSAMVSRVATAKALPSDLLEKILTKTDGVPLFVEELTKSILESGELKDAGDHYEYVGSARNITIPATLRDSLMARLDRFAPVKEVAQIGAAIGREFSYELLAAVAPMAQTPLDVALSQLTDSGLAFRRGTPPDAIYTFKHALVRDAAYDSLLKSRRQALHAELARVLEKQFPDAKDTEPELLAHHLTAAGLPEPAISYWLKAAKRAALRSAYQEALIHLDQGTALLEGLPSGHERLRAELQLQLQRATALLATKGMSAVQTGEAYGAAWRLWERLGGDLRGIFPALYGIYSFHFVRGEYSQALESAQEALRRAQQINDSALLTLAHRMVAAPLEQRGALLGAAEHLHQVGRLYDLQRDRESASVYGSDFKAHGLAYLAFALFLLGSADQARAAANDGVNHAVALDHLHSIALQLYWFSLVHVLCREPELAFEHAKRAMELSEKHGFGQYYEMSKANCGVALIQLGKSREGIALMQESLRRSESMGIKLNRPFYLAELAVGAAEAKQWEEAKQLLNEAIAQAGASGESWCEAEIYRLKGELRLAQNSAAAAAEAQDSFLRSLDVARSQSAKAWELRTATSLARLWHSQGEHKQAYDLLCPVYDCFSEGFDTKDLKAAKALLDEVKA